MGQRVVDAELLRVAVDARRPPTAARGPRRCGRPRSRRTACCGRRSRSRRRARRRRPARPRRAGGRRRRGDLGPHELLALRRPRLDDLPARQAQLEALDHAAAQRQRLVLRTVPSARSRCGVVKTSSVGRLGTCACPRSVRWRAGDPARALDQADLEVGARPAVAQRASKPRSVSRRRPRVELVEPLAPTRRRDPARRGAARAPRRPTAGRRRARRRPRGPTPRSGRRGSPTRSAGPSPRRPTRGRSRGSARLPSARGRRPRRSRRARRRRSPSTAAPSLAARSHPLDHPRRRPAERVLRREVDLRPAHPRIGVERRRRSARRPRRPAWRSPGPAARARAARARAAPGRAGGRRR